MHEILHRLPISASINNVFEIVSTPSGLNKWWTLTAQGTPEINKIYDLGFGPGYDWKARVTKVELDRKFELLITEAMDDWKGVTVGFDLEPNGDMAILDFYNGGWKEAGDHFRTTSFCWSMYLRIMKRSLEFGEEVPYDERLEV